VMNQKRKQSWVNFGEGIAESKMEVIVPE